MAARLDRQELIEIIYILSIVSVRLLHNVWIELKDFSEGTLQKVFCSEGLRIPLEVPYTSIMMIPAGTAYRYLQIGRWRVMIILYIWMKDILLLPSGRMPRRIITLLAHTDTTLSYRRFGQNSEQYCILPGQSRQCMCISMVFLSVIHRVLKHRRNSISPHWSGKA